MGFGTLTASIEETCQIMSPRVQSHKRTADINDSGSDAESDYKSDDCTTVHKKAKMSFEPDCSPSVSTRVGSSPPASSDFSPMASSPSDEQGCVGQHVTPVKQEPSKDAAVEACMRVFREAWFSFAVQRDAGKGCPLKREDKASEMEEMRVSETYQEIKDAISSLLPWLGPLTPVGEHKKYEVVEFQGLKPPHHLQKGNESSEVNHEDLVTEQLQWLRNETDQGRVWEALCAVMAVLSTRKEKCWLEACETQDTIEEEIANEPFCKSKSSSRRKSAIRALIEKESSLGRNGFYVHYLVRPTTNLRVAFAMGETNPTPASLVVTARLPLWEALDSLADDQPLRGAAKSRKWCMEAGRQFAFQDANFAVDEKARDASQQRNYRAKALALKPDPAIRDLLRSRKPVVQLEILAALAPRDIARKEGLSDIVKMELTRVMCEAKERGEAVVFCLGSDCPHLLAQKVYMRQPMSDYGLRCGYLRWRASAGVPWARESPWDDRTCLCLQMP